MQRRTALGGIFGTVVASHSASAGKKPPSGKRVIVIGAGLSGLAAARACMGDGHDVLVMEARERIGGRLWTSRDWPGIPVDLGASWIHGIRRNPLTALANEAALRRVPTRYESSLALDSNGEELDIEEAAEEADAFVARARRRAQAKSGDVSLQSAIVADPEWKDASPERRRAIRHFVNSNFEHEYSGDWSELSAKTIDSDEEFGGGDTLFPGGFDQLAHHLAKGVAVKLGLPARRIARVGKGGVRVHTALGYEDADRVIVTVPLGVLQSGDLTFEDPLSPGRTKAIGALGMGLLNKCWLWFDKTAWPDNVDWIEWLGPRDGYWAEWVSMANGLGLPVLVGFHAGIQARDMERLNDQETMGEAHAALRKMFGNNFPQPKAAQITRWSQDPFTRGSYSFNRVGSRSATRRHLGGTDWDGLLSFAGEATSADYSGTAHGAYLSGLAAAKAV